ncbi:intraflagellar transport protein 140 homolog [Salmo salar]|uniref:Intraflagellar transport protein 140 homolog n=1 Tax=Salmo salar TaxID=8030 RepID=A0A1S3NB88_SALSA|nr:intraflagellar transport protein 140 homolog [Salmo salar]|eukprot:XP_014012376.1 PREDICTED: intraflagellar transport protein 140 homolog [Salmo salar]
MEIEGIVTQIQWVSNLSLLAANSVIKVLILCEHVMSAHLGQQVAAVQQTPSQLSLTMFSTNSHLTLCSDIHIKGVCITKIANPKMCLVTLGNQPINLSRHQGNQPGRLSRNLFLLNI